jgi:hypothetical protein
MSRIALLLICSLASLAAPAGGPGKVKYVAPAGFGTHKWGDLRTSFERLPEQPKGVAAAWLVPTDGGKEPFVMCSSSTTLGRMSSGTVESCNIQTAIDSLRGRTDYGGFYVLSEYSIEDQGFRFGTPGASDSVVLHPVVYQFCANWFDPKREPPPKFDELNKFCGVKLHFQSDTREQLRKLPADHVTNYDRVLDKLIARFGRPDGFLRRGRVVIETLEGDSADEGDRKFSIWRWCPARDRGFHTSCTASVTLALNPQTGVGTVLYATPPLWEFAYARQNNGFKGDPLFKLLHARK